MSSLSNRIQTTCRNLRDDNDDFFNSSDVLACRNVASDFSTVFGNDIQDFIFNNKGYDKDEWEKYKEKCRAKVIDLKNNYNLDNANIYYNCLIGEDSNTFGEAVFGNRRRNFVKKNNDKYNDKKNQFETLEKELMNALNRTAGNNEVYKKMRGLKNLNTDIEKNISELKDHIVNDYKDREDLQYDQIIKNYRIIDVNNKMINKMNDNVSYINKKLEIVNDKYNKTKSIYNFVKILLIVLVIVNIGLAGYYYYLIKNKKI